MGREWSTSESGHRVMRRTVRRSYAERRGVSSDGLEHCREILQGLGEGRMLSNGELSVPVPDLLPRFLAAHRSC
jgi:hypothetical protein